MFWQQSAVSQPITESGIMTQILVNKVPQLEIISYLMTLGECAATEKWFH